MMGMPEIAEWLAEVLVSVALALFLRLAVVNLAHIRGSSMMPTLRNGEWALVWRLGYYLRAPRRQEVIICHYPGRRMKRCKYLPQTFVKRVIGIPGDTISFADGRVHVNGVPLDEPYLDPANCRFLRDRPPFTLGADEYFVMGDNRDHSHDSRSVGCIRRRAICGRVVCVLWPVVRVRRVR